MPLKKPPKAAVVRVLQSALPMAVTLLLISASAACYHPVPVTAAASPASAAGDSLITTTAATGSAPGRKAPPRCASYFLVVENALPRAVEIYEVGHMTDRFVVYAQIGITEVPMTESSQQFVAMSRGELMAASSNFEQRPGDRVALQRSCRTY